MPDPQLTEKELQALLRLKRYEQPAPAYFDGLLKDVHRQQQVDRATAGEEPALTETQLQALLRLKRHEQPPPAYFDGLLANIHRRQRDELLRPPAWRQFLERLAAAFAGLFRDRSYVGTMAGVLLIGLGLIQWILPTYKPQPSPQYAGASTPGTPGESVPVMIAENESEENRLIDIRNPNYHPVRTPRKSTSGSNGLRSTMPTRFIIDTQPASYEATEIKF